MTTARTHARTLRDWIPQERPRERLLARGPGVLSDAELLAVFLGSGRRGETAVDVARGLLHRHESLSGLMQALEDGQAVPCLGPARRAVLLAVRELGVRLLEQRVRRAGPLISSRDAADWLRARLAHRMREVFCVVFLDTRHRVLACDDLFEGTLTGTAVYPREVVRRALHHHAAAVILAHNHPSGIAEPSVADEALTRRMKDALAMVDVRVLDHLVIGIEGVVSFSERGAM